MPKKARPLRNRQSSFPLGLPASDFRDFDSAQEWARQAASELTARDRTVFAQAFSYRVVSVWWGAVAHTDMPLRPLLVDSPATAVANEVAMVAECLGQTAATLDIEEAAYRIGLVYSGLLPDVQRATLGVYYTPPALAARLLDQATVAGVDWRSCTVLDPACGGGAFLAPVARRMLAAMDRIEVTSIAELLAHRLHGFEIDPFSAWLSQVAVDAVVSQASPDALSKLPPLVTVCDSLRNPPITELFDLVVGNPPYGRVKLEQSARARFARGLYGHANLYGLFTEMALNHTRAGGVIAFVTPTSFLAGQYFKNLRSLLGNDAPPATLDFIVARKGVFADVLQEALLATYRRGGDSAAATVFQVATANGAGTTDVERVGTFSLPNDRSQPWLVPRAPDQARLVARMREMPHRLRDWGYRVSTGPLVWNRHKWQLAWTRKTGNLPLIWAESVGPGGSFEWKYEKRNHAPYFEPKVGDDWLITRSPCVLLQRTTAKEQRRRLIAAGMSADLLGEYGAVVVENHLNMLRPANGKACVRQDVLVAFLNSRAADVAFRCVSGSVAVSAYELEALPLPEPAALGHLEALVSANAPQAEINQACDALYGITSLQ